MTDRLEGLTAVVTGGSSGMGYETARALARQGARVVITDLNRPSGDLGPLAFVRVDNRDVSAIAAAVRDIEKTSGSVDILVNNAGISGQSLPISQIDETAFDAMFEIHVKGAFFFTQAVVPGMRRKRFGRIVNITSYFVLAGSSSMSHYVGAKAALHGLTRSWALEFAGGGITVNAVAP
ncbi:MAG: SDR family oxidoreductase, partial [Rhodobacteraceae bacterium]|nr:SDR family oxidoreductase [Paracoccaceae bacterium]